MPYVYDQTDTTESLCIYVHHTSGLAQPIYYCVRAQEPRRYMTCNQLILDRQNNRPAEQAESKKDLRLPFLFAGLNYGHSRRAELLLVNLVNQKIALIIF